VNVVAGGAFPITGFSTSATQSTNQFTQTLTGYPLTGSYVANCSSFYSASGTEQPWRCFDKNNNGTWWTTATGSYSTTDGSYTGGIYSTTISGSAYAGEWIQIQLPVAIILTSYTIYTSSIASRAPKTFKLAGSNDGTTWTLVDTQTGITSWASSATNLTFTPSTQTTAYTYYRLCVNIGNNAVGQPYLTIGELVLNGTVPSLSQDFYADRLGNLLTAPVTGQSLANWLGGATGYVTTWYDQSGAGNHASQATAANQPVIQRATKGAGYSCLFNGTTNSFTYGSPSTFPTNYQLTISGVVRRNSSADMRMTGYGANDGQNYFAAGFGSTTLVFNSRAGYYQMAYTIPAYSPTSEPLYYTTYTVNNSVNVYGYINGSYVAQGPWYFPGATTGPPTIGNVAGGIFFSGEIYELIVFTKSLYDLDTSGGLVTQIYQNQLSAYGT
jgi:hypothetical protein